MSTTDSHKYKTIAACASIPERKKALAAAVGSLRDQVDQVLVYLNGYGDVPAFLEDDEKVTVTRSEDTGIDRGDAGMFYHIDQIENAYYLTFGDDIIYPPDYVSKLVAKIEKYDRKSAISFHGWDVKKGQRSYHNDRAVNHHFENELKQDTSVHILSTNSFGFFTGTCKISYSLFERANMADLFLSKRLNEMNVPRIVAEHPSRWILPSVIVDPSKSIFATMSKNEGSERFQTRLINEISWSKPKTSKARRTKKAEKH